MPLNINWQQILLHMFNFVILAGGLYLLLYKPVKDFMDKRTAYYQKMETDAKAHLASAQAMEQDYQSRLEQVEQEISERKTAAAKEAKAAANDKIASANRQAEQILSDARLTAENERKKIVDSASKEIAELASDAAEKLVAQSIDSAYGAFLDAARGGDDHDEEL